MKKLFIVSYFDKYKKVVCFRIFKRYLTAKIFIRAHKIKNYKFYELKNYYKTDIESGPIKTWSFREKDVLVSMYQYFLQKEMK